MPNKSYTVDAFFRVFVDFYPLYVCNPEWAVKHGIACHLEHYSQGTDCFLGKKIDLLFEYLLKKICTKKKRLIIESDSVEVVNGWCVRTLSNVC